MPIRQTMGVTAVLSTTPQSIYNILAAIDPTAPRNVRSLRVTADVGNADTVLFGDSLVSAARYSDGLRPATVDKVEEKTDGRGSISITNKYVRGLAATPSIHIYVDCY